MELNQGNFDKVAKLIEHGKDVQRTLTFLITKQRNRAIVLGTTIANAFLMFVNLIRVIDPETRNNLQFISILLILTIAEILVFIVFSSQIKTQAKLTSLKRGVSLDILEDNKTVESFTIINYQVFFTKSFFKAYKNVALFDLDEKKIIIRTPILESELYNDTPIRNEAFYDSFTIAIDSNKSLDDILSFLGTCNFLQMG